MTAGASRFMFARKLVIATLAMLFLTQVMPLAEASDIPHENYEFVSADIQVIVDLLNLSINYTELSLVNLLDEQVVWSRANLSTVTGLLAPAQRLILQGLNTSDSYSSLAHLMPPFSALSVEEGRFIGMESELIAARDVIRSFKDQTTLTPEDALEAMTAINKMSSLIVSMNRSIDEMIVHAETIIGLQVEDRFPFQDNDLLQLLEMLRNLLYAIELELADFIEGSTGQGGGPNIWQSVPPFITLYLVSSNIYLGERFEGGGYLFYNGSFREGRQVNLSMDGGLLVTATTQAQGLYEFSYDTPVNSSWLGEHQLIANSTYRYGTLVSDPVTLRIRLIPTFLFISVNKEILAPNETLSIDLRLLDAKGNPVIGGECDLTVSPRVIPLTTDFEGESSWADSAADVGYGTHTVQAEYDAELPYEPSISKAVIVTVNIPTSIELIVTTDRLIYQEYYYISGHGLLLANGSQPLGDMTITLSIDGDFAENVSTGPDGEFAFSIDNQSLEVGVHTVTAELVYRDDVWGYCYAEETFTILVRKKADYPFWPFIPGWQTLGPSLTYPDLFFGPNAYIFWLFIVLVLWAIIRAIQVRKSMADKRLAAQKAQAAGEAFGVAESEVPVFGGAGISAEAIASESPPSHPNARVIWYYNRFIRFLVKKLMIGISPTMTHREIAALLGKVGYSLRPVNKITLLFEQAMYSGEELSEIESDSMGSMVEDFEKSKEGSVAT